MMEEGFRLMQSADGESTICASRPDHRAAERTDDSWSAARSRRLLFARARETGGGGIGLFRCDRTRALAAWEALKDDVPGLVCWRSPSPDLLHRGWSERRSGGGQAKARTCRTSRRCSRRCEGCRARDVARCAPRRCPARRSRRHKSDRSAIERFGQTGNLADLYRAYRLDVDAIVEAAAELFLD